MAKPPRKSLSVPSLWARRAAVVGVGFVVNAHEAQPLHDSRHHGNSRVGVALQVRATVEKEPVHRALRLPVDQHPRGLLRMSDPSVKTLSSTCFDAPRRVL